jgi:outer membrane protein
MRTTIFFIIVLTLFVQSTEINGQSSETLALSELIEMGLESNPALQIMKNREGIANNNHTFHTFLPSMRATSRQNNSETSGRSVHVSAPEREFSNVRSHTLNAGLNFTWRVFDGLGMFAAYKMSSYNLTITELQTRRTVENLVVDISDQYYRIVVQEHRLDAAHQLMDLSRERFRIIREQVNIGTASGMDLQQARLDFNADSSYFVRQKETLQNSYIRLNQLVNTQLTQANYVSDTILLGSPLILDDLELQAEANNSALMSARAGIQLSEAEIRLARAGYFPTIDLVSGYVYNRSEAPASVTTFSESRGFNYGLEASMNVFNGFQVNRNIKNAKIERENRKLSYDETHLQVMAELHILYNTYLNNLMMVDFEKQNVEVSRANLNLALERYELGVLSGLGFREFQLSYINSVDRSLDAMYQSKVLELSLLVASGLMDEFLFRID